MLEEPSAENPRGRQRGYCLYENAWVEEPVNKAEHAYLLLGVTWDGCEKATFSFKCDRCELYQSCEVTDFTDEVVTDGCTGGVIRHTASVVLGRILYTDTAEEILPPSHDLVYSSGTEPTCTEGGHMAGWTCSRCGKHFLTEAGAEEIPEEDWILPPLPLLPGTSVIRLPEGNTPVFSVFTPEETGAYRFRCGEGAIRPAVEVYDGDEPVEPCEAFSAFSRVVELEAGKEYRVRFESSDGAGEAQVSIQPTALFGIYIVPSAENGQISAVQGVFPAQDGSAAAMAYAGAEVSLLAEPDEEFFLAGITVTDAEGTVISDSLQFTMPCGDAAVTAEFTSVPHYFVYFVNWNGETLQLDLCTEGEVPAFAGPDPVCEPTEAYLYTFTGWDRAIGPVTDVTVYTATYARTLRSYPVRFLDWDGTELQGGDLAYGQTPAYTGEDPSRPADAEAGFAYAFSGWSPEITPVAGEAVYTAVYEALPLLAAGENDLALAEGAGPVTCVFAPGESGAYRFSCDAGWLTAVLTFRETGSQAADAYRMWGSFSRVLQLEAGKIYDVVLEPLSGTGWITLDIRRASLFSIYEDPGMVHGHFVLDEYLEGIPVGEGGVIAMAYGGSEVGLRGEFDAGYGPAEITIVDADGETVSEESVFTMPESDVTVCARFEPTYSLTWEADEHAEFDIVMIDGDLIPGRGVWDAFEGQTAELHWYCEEGYMADSISVTTASGEAVPWTIVWRQGWNLRLLRFEMPSGAVTVTMSTRPFTFDRADFMLPAGLLAIESNAFEGDLSITVAVIPEGCESIGAQAFKDCRRLEHILIPAGCAVGADAFEGCDWVWIHSAPGSPAEQYCDTHDNCAFVSE
ncbi:MAG: leucine-rich repeat protein [Clostridia bacterium]|nr:leucine-rich repeat protein [Clostridia bacterium]